MTNVTLIGGPVDGRVVNVIEGCHLINVPVIDQQDEWVAKYDAATGSYLGDTERVDRNIGDAQRWADFYAWLWRDFDPPDYGART